MGNISNMFTTVQILQPLYMAMIKYALKTPTELID